MKILAIESSCDETAASVVEDGKRVISNVISSQISEHKKTGGVVPEVAAREHMKFIVPVVKKAMEGLSWDEIDAIAVTKTPGLVGSLVVGQSAASALALAHDKPLIEVNHIHGHLYSNWLDSEDEPEFPALVLTVSGGHSDLFLMHGHGDFEQLGGTKDDAAGEAFDKVARMLGMDYPGGPAIEKAALKGNKEFVKFPRAQMQGYDYSCSGLKTAVLYYLRDHEDEMTDGFKNDVAASFQEAICDSLVGKAVKALKNYDVKEVHMAGGCSANGRLREILQDRLPEGVKFRHPAKISYCTDNAAMIAAVAFYLR